MDEPLQKSLERYDVLDRIAVGGMAEVFLAKAYGAHGFEKTLAIKRILPELARDPEFEARFIAEAKVAVRLSHANVVQVMDFGRIGDSLFIAMEYVDGLDLAAMLRKFKDEKRQVPLPAAMHIAIEIVRALDFAHSHNVVHRDVSPSNILVSRAGEVKIADFGIAVAAQPHRGAGAGPKRVMGKWRYMSPEQTRGDTLDTRSDLFSAASVIWELFTNEKLFPGDEAEDIIKNIAEMPIPKMGSIRPGVPSRLDDVLAGPLSRKPIDRPSRPAVVLRSLIELSYESSIMATALDVAEALATVIPPRRQSGRGALDDVIRKQLADQSIARRTAITDGKPSGSTETAATGVHGGDVSTGLFRKIDVDGLSRLEEVDVDTKVAAPRARRNSEQGGAMPGDTDLHRLYEQSLDKDRHTEPGGPPTGQVPKSGDSLAMKSTGSQSTYTGKSSRALWVVVALLVLGGGGAGLWALMREEKAPVVDVHRDGGAEVMGTLDIDSIPTGATITVDNQVHKQRTAPYSFRVPAGKKVRVRLELKGYDSLEEDYVVEANQIRDVKRPLTPSPAKLHVETTPAGAEVTVNKQPAGTTPFTKPFPADRNVEIEIAKPGYEPIKQTVDLLAGETLDVVLELKETQKFGSVQIKVTGVGWVAVYLGGRSLGMNQTTQGLATIQLPIGKHLLRLVNKPANKEKTVPVVIEERKTTQLKVAFD